MPKIYERYFSVDVARNSHQNQINEFEDIVISMKNNYSEGDYK